MMTSELYSLLLQRMGGGSGVSAGPGPSVRELLSQLAETDPRAALLARYWAQRETAESESTPSADVVAPEVNGAIAEEAGNPDDGPRIRRALASEQLQRMAKAMYTELEHLRERNDMLASALGACYLCWGADPACPVCQGDGSPGFYRPDALLFNQLIAPVQRLLRANGARILGSSRSGVSHDRHLAGPIDEHQGTRRDDGPQAAAGHAAP